MKGSFDARELMRRRHRRTGVRSRCMWLLPLLGLVLGCTGIDLDRTGLVKISDHSYAFIAHGPAAEDGLGANAGFVVGTEGVLVVDTRLTAEMAEELLDAVRAVTEAPVRYVVNTHYHPDHAWGNSVFKAAGAVILSRPETRRDLAEYTPVYLEFYREHSRAAYERIKDLELVLPDSTFGDELRLDLGGVEAVLDHFGPGHTAGDCIVTVPADRIAYAGGILSNGYHPNLGDQGGDLENWLGILNRLEAMKLKLIVPGQGLVCRPGQLKKQAAYITELRARCIEEIEKGTPVEGAALAIELPGTEDYLQPNILPFNVQMIYRRELIGVVRPDFTLDVPEAFVTVDGGGNTTHGRLQWSREIPGGYLEIEVQWQPTNRRDIIFQDITDAVARRNASGGVRELVIDGPRRIEIGRESAPAISGTWAYRQETMVRGGGLWIWTMVLRGGKLYLITGTTVSTEDAAVDGDRMRELERIVSTFRVPS